MKSDRYRELLDLTEELEKTKAENADAIKKLETEICPETVAIDCKMFEVLQQPTWTQKMPVMKIRSLLII